jgi:hypothetical protein
MGLSTTSTSALIEILNLCAETLISLHSDQGIVAVPAEPKKIDSTSSSKRTIGGPRLVLISGGLSKTTHSAASR